jgi:hypothetical protein
VNVAVVIPTSTAGDDWRARALDYVRRFYETNHRRWPIVLGEPASGEWSKGAAVAAGIAQLPDDVDVLVLADADSYIPTPATLVEAVHLIANGTAEWVVPHRLVYRLRESETVRAYETGKPARLGHTCRTPYAGPAGGGITVLTRRAFDTVAGIDARYKGWGGEDVSFGWALETLVHPEHRLVGSLVHLWHPHPAPNLRGSAESEALVARYLEARGYPRRMAALVAGETWEPLPDLDRPIRFRIVNTNRRSLRLFGSSTIIRFDRSGWIETVDADLADALRRHEAVREEALR